MRAARVADGGGVIKACRNTYEVCFNTQANDGSRVLDIPASHAPAPGIVKLPPQAMAPEPVLDPFEVGSRSLDVLAQELGALGRARLLNIIAAYDMNPNGQDLQQLTNGQLIRFIVVAVEIGLLQRAR